MDRSEADAADEGNGAATNVVGTDVDAADVDAAAVEALECVCEAGDVLDMLSSRHAISIVCAVGALQPVRYGQIEDALGDASSSTLSTRLQDLVDAGVLAREQYDEIPPRVEYELTDDGEALYDALGPLVDWVQARRR